MAEVYKIPLRCPVCGANAHGQGVDEDNRFISETAACPYGHWGIDFTAKEYRVYVGSQVWTWNHQTHREDCRRIQNEIVDALGKLRKELSYD